MIFKQETIESWFTGVGSSINNEVVQPFQNANNIISKYNLAIQHNSLTQQGWQRILAQSDDSLRAYLTSIKGTTASMSAYNASLQGNITGFTKIPKAMQQYNALGVTSQKEQQAFATAVGVTNSKLGSYLTGLNGAKASLSGYGLSLITSTAKTIGLTVATAALNATLTMGISLIASGLISAFVSWIHKSEAITEKAQEAADKINSINDSLKSNIQTVENAKKRYAELAQKVENLGKITQSQGTLSNEEYKEFLDLSNQLAGIFPSLTKNYDDNGNAILDLSGDVNTIIGSLDSLIQKEKEFTNQKIMEKFPDVFKNWNQDLSDAEQKVKSAKTEFDKVNNAYQQLSNGTTSQAFDLQGNGWFTNENGEKITISMGEYISSLEALGLKHEETQLKIKNQFGGDTLSGYLIEATGDIDTAFTSKLEKARKNLQYAQQQLEGQRSSINQHLNTWLQGEFSYIQIEDSGLQTAIQDMLFNFDWDNIPEDKRGDWNYVSEYLRRNILFEINKVQNDPVISKAFSEVFTNAELTPDEKAIYLQQIKDFFGEDSAVVISLKPQIEETETLQKQYDRSIEDTKKKFDGYDPTTFFKEHSINTQEEIDAWQKIAQGAKDAAEAEKEYIQSLTASESDSPSFSSFSEAWASLDNIKDDNSPLKNLKENLLELANAGHLTAESFQSTAGANAWMEQMKGMGLSVEDVINKINNLKSVSSADQLASMKTGISSISSILTQKKENLSNKDTETTGIGADTLAGMPTELKSCQKEYQKFCKVLGNGKSSMTKCRKAANELATAYVNSNNFLSQLTDKNQDYYISVLEEMGVENANAIVTNEVAKQKGIAALESENLSDMTYDVINNLIEETAETDNARDAMRLFALEKIYANGKGLDTTEDINQLIYLIESLGLTSKALKLYRDYQDGKLGDAPGLGMVLEYNAMKEMEKIIKKLNKKAKVTSPEIKSGSSPKENAKPKENPVKETTQVINWIERHLHNLQTTIDLTSAKLQNLFSVKAKNNNLNKQIKTTTKLINAYGVAAEKYQQKANKVAKASSKTVEDDDGKKKKVKINALSKGILNKIKSGKLTKKTSVSSLIKEYGEDTAEKIQSYIDWYDKAQDAKKNKQEQITKKRELRQQKHQNIADKAQSQIDKLEAQKENVPISNAAKKNSLLKSQLKYIKQSYNEQIKIAKIENDTVKAATLLAQKYAEIREIKKQILQNSLDKNEEKRTLSDAKYSNAKTTAEKNALLGEKIATYKADKKAYKSYYKDAKSDLDSAKSNVSSALVMPSKVSGLTKSDKNKIKSLMQQGKKIPKNLLDKVKNSVLLQRLKDYNAKVDEVSDAKYTYDLGKEQSDTAIRESQVEKHQNLANDAEAKYNLEQQLESNANTAKDKNKHETASRKHLKEQYSELIAIAHLNNDITEEKRLQAEQDAKIAESYKKEFDNIQAEYSQKTGRIDSEIGVTQAEISALEAQGKKLSTAFYDSMIKAEQNKKSELLAERSALEEKLSKLTVGSADWYDAKNTLDSVSTALYECDQNTAEWQKTINELNMKPFENLLSCLEATESRIEFLINMLSHNDLVDEDTGAFTSDGLATMSLQLDEIAGKQKQIETLREEWSNFDFSKLSEEEIIAKNKEFQEAIQSRIESIASLKEGIIDLCENAFNTQLNSLNDLISKYKDALNAEEDLYQYQKKIKQQTKTIASLMKQQAALKGDESEEARAKLQQITVKLQEAQEDLEETERQKTIDDINDMLDDLSEDFEEYISSTLKDTDTLIENIEKAVKENPDAIAKAISNLGYGNVSDTNVKENSDGSKDISFSTSDGGSVTNHFDKDGNYIGSTVTDANGAVVSSSTAAQEKAAQEEATKGTVGGHISLDRTQGLALNMGETILEKARSLNTVTAMNNLTNYQPEPILRSSNPLQQGTSMGDITLNLNGSNVVDFKTFKQEFVNELQTDSTFKSTLGNAVTGMVVGSQTNRLRSF